MTRAIILLICLSFTGCGDTPYKFEDSLTLESPVKYKFTRHRDILIRETVPRPER